MKELKALKPIKDDHRMTFILGDRNESVTYSRRELRFFGAQKDVVEIRNFVSSVGLWENFSVAKGMDTNAICKRNVNEVSLSVDTLLSMIEADQELYEFNYEYKFDTSHFAKKRRYFMDANQDYGCLKIFPGLMYFKYSEKDGYKDLRRNEIFEVIEWNEPKTILIVQLAKRRNHFDLPGKLRAIREFLLAAGSEVVGIRHHGY